MNGLIESQNQAKRHYAPLEVSVSLACITPGAPMLQVYGDDGYAPDRSLVYSVVAPVITAYAKDGSWDNRRSNLALVNMKWLSNAEGTWKDITTMESWKGKYEIDTSSTTSRGNLTIKKNLGVNNKEQIRLSASIYDYRTGTNIDQMTDFVTLSCIAKGTDTWGIGFGDARNIVYNPFLDKLDLYDYKVANSLMAASTDARNACFDGNQYERTIPVDVYLGKNRKSSGYTLAVYRMDNGREVALSASPNSELKALTLTSLTLDLRVVEQATYLVKCTADGKVVAQGTFSVSRDYPPISSPEFTNKASIAWGDIYRRQQAVFHFNNRIVDYPARLIRMLWKTKATRKEYSQTVAKEWNEGDTLRYNIEDSGIGELEDDKVIEIVAYGQKKAYDIATDAAGNVYGDSSGNAYIVR